MKKTISVLLAIAMLFTLCVPAFAAATPVDLTADGTAEVIVKTDTKKDTDGDGVGDTEVEGFTLSIPADTVIPWGQEETDVSFKLEAHLTRNKAVNVTVAGSADKKMKTADAVYGIPYALVDTDASDDAVTYTEGPAVYDTVNDTGVIFPVKVVVTSDDWNTAVVEAFQDTLTYTATVVTTA